MPPFGSLETVGPLAAAGAVPNWSSRHDVGVGAGSGATDSASAQLGGTDKVPSESA